jgi:DNA/RNA endonuclease YhcR with UshA esterase domain
MTLTCTVDGTEITVRTMVLRHEDGSLVTQDELMGKTIDVTGIIDYFGGDYQIKVFTPEDITIH